MQSIKIVSTSATFELPDDTQRVDDLFDIAHACEKIVASCNSGDDQTTEQFEAMLQALSVFFTERWGVHVSPAAAMETYRRVTAAYVRLQRRWLQESPNSESVPEPAGTPTE